MTGIKGSYNFNLLDEMTGSVQKTEIMPSRKISRL